MARSLTRFGALGQLAAVVVPHDDDARRAEDEGAHRPGDQRVDDRAEERRPEAAHGEPLHEGRDEPEEQRVDHEHEQAG